MLKHTFTPPKLLHLSLSKHFNFDGRPETETSYDIECSDPVRSPNGLKMEIVYTWRFHSTGTDRKGEAVCIYEQKAEIECWPELEDLESFNRVTLLSFQAVVFEFKMMRVYEDYQEIFMEDPPGKLRFVIPKLSLPKVVHDVIAGIYG